MPIQIGTQTINSIFTQTFVDAAPIPVSSSVIGLLSGSYSNGSTWTSTTGSAVDVINNPLTGQAVNGRWQFNGTDDYLRIPQSTLNATFITNAAVTQSFTFLFYGTIGDVSTRRALFGAAGFTSYNQGGDAIIRTDSSPPAGKMHIDLRGTGGATNRFTITAVSGSVLNLAITQNASGLQSVYQNGAFLASTASSVAYYPWRSGDASSGANIGYNDDTDTDNYNGQLGAVYLYNRELSAAEITASAKVFDGTSVGGMEITPVGTVFLGSTKIFPPTNIGSLSALGLVVGGGGAGGVGTGGGGGAGGMVTGSLTLTASTYTVTVGSGGLSSAGPVGLNLSTQSGNPGQTSSFSTVLVAFGGGGGFAYEGTQNTANGGSGGGPSDTRLRQPVAGTVVLGGSGSVGQGNKGGDGTYGSQFGNGGGGAGQAGQVGNAGSSPRRAGAGGSGSLNSYRTGTGTFYAGGGGGAGYNAANGGLGGPGGGGNGGGPSGGSGATGSINTGGGGGAGNRNVNGTVNGVGAGGGSGIVVIAYLTASFSSSGLTSVSGGIVQDYTSGSAVYRSHTFLSSSNLVLI